jgi:hypothetical protein
VVAKALKDLARRESVNSTAHHNKKGWAGRFESSNFGYTESMPWYSVARPADAAFSDSEVDFGKAIGTCNACDCEFRMAAFLCSIDPAAD